MNSICLECGAPCDAKLIDQDGQTNAVSPCCGKPTAIRALFKCSVCDDNTPVDQLKVWDEIAPEIQSLLVSLDKAGGVGNSTDFVCDTCHFKADSMVNDRGNQ